MDVPYMISTTTYNEFDQACALPCIFPREGSQAQGILESGPGFRTCLVQTGAKPGPDSQKGLRSPYIVLTAGHDGDDLALGIAPAIYAAGTCGMTGSILNEKP